MEYCKNLIFLLLLNYKNSNRAMVWYDKEQYLSLYNGFIKLSITKTIEENNVT